MAKMLPPPSVEAAIADADDLLFRAAQENAPDLRSIPQWVRMYFHPQTLKESIALGMACLVRSVLGTGVRIRSTRTSAVGAEDTSLRWKDSPSC